MNSTTRTNETGGTLSVSAIRPRRNTVAAFVIPMTVKAASAARNWAEESRRRRSIREPLRAAAQEIVRHAGKPLLGLHGCVAIRPDQPRVKVSSAPNQPAFGRREAEKKTWASRDEFGSSFGISALILFEPQRQVAGYFCVGGRNCAKGRQRAHKDQCARQFHSEDLSRIRAYQTL